MTHSLLALLLFNYTIALADLPDRRDDRMKPIQDVVNLYRDLADQRPDLYQGDLGVALSEYAHVMDAADRPKGHMISVSKVSHSCVGFLYYISRIASKIWRSISRTMLLTQ